MVFPSFMQKTKKATALSALVVATEGSSRVEMKRWMGGGMSRGEG